MSDLAIVETTLVVFMAFGVGFAFFVADKLEKIRLGLEMQLAVLEQHGISDDEALRRAYARIKRLDRSK